MKPSALVAMRAMMRRLMCGLPAKCPSAAIINERTFTNQEQSKRAFRNPRLSDSRALPSTHDAGLITFLHFFFGIVFEPLLHRRLHVFPPLHTTASAQPAFLTDWDDGRSEFGTKVGGTRADSYDIVGAPSISGGRNACTCGNRSSHRGRLGLGLGARRCGPRSVLQGAWAVVAGPPLPQRDARPPSEVEQRPDRHPRNVVFALRRGWI